MLKDPIQKLLVHFNYFFWKYIWSFRRYSNTQTQKTDKKTKTIEIFLNKTLTTNPHQNEKIVQENIENKQIRTERIKSFFVQGKPIFIYSKLSALGRNVIWDLMTFTRLCKKINKGIQQPVALNWSSQIGVSATVYDVLFNNNRYIQQ